MPRGLSPEQRPDDRGDPVGEGRDRDQPPQEEGGDQGPAGEQRGAVPSDTGEGGRPADGDRQRQCPHEPPGDRGQWTPWLTHDGPPRPGRR